NGLTSSQASDDSGLMRVAWHISLTATACQIRQRATLDYFVEPDPAPLYRSGIRVLPGLARAGVQCARPGWLGALRHCTDRFNHQSTGGEPPLATNFLRRGGLADLYSCLPVRAFH